MQPSSHPRCLVDPVSAIASAVGGITNMIGGLAGGSKKSIAPQIIEKPVNIYVPVKEKVSASYGFTFAGVGFALGVFVGMLLNPPK